MCVCVVVNWRDCAISIHPSLFKTVDGSSRLPSSVSIWNEFRTASAFAARGRPRRVLGVNFIIVPCRAAAPTNQPTNEAENSFFFFFFFLVDTYKILSLSLSRSLCLVLRRYAKQNYTRNEWSAYFSFSRSAACVWVSVPVFIIDVLYVRIYYGISKGGLLCVVFFSFDYFAPSLFLLIRKIVCFSLCCSFTNSLLLWITRSVWCVCVFWTKHIHARR